MARVDCFAVQNLRNHAVISYGPWRYWIFWTFD